MHRQTVAGLAAAVVLATAGCAAGGTVESADIPAWKATALPAASGMVFEDAGKILDRTPVSRTAPAVPAGAYTLTLTCDGGGKLFVAVSLDGTTLAEAGAACNGSKETAKIRVPSGGTLEFSAYSVDAPLIYGYQLVPAA